MFNNKKSDELAPEALARTLITVVIILLIVFPAYNRLHAAFLSSEKKYLQSFENFVNAINKMTPGRQSFELRLNDKSAIIGFSKNTDRYECFNCYSAQNRPTIIFNKPVNEECSGSACICLCKEGFKFEVNDIEGKPTEIGQCQKLACKKIENQDVIDRTIISPNSITESSENTAYWKNGFLFANGVPLANGLKPYDEEYTTLVVEKKSDIIGICNSDMLKIRKELGSYDCILTEYNEDKKIS